MDAIPDSTTVPLKRCNKCGCDFPATVEYFHLSNNGLYGLRQTCKSCRKAIAHERHKNDPSISRDAARRRREKYPERVRNARQRYLAENRNKVRDYQQRWANANPERVSAKHKRWAEKNHSATRVKSRNRRARKAALPATFTSAHERIALEYFHGRCAICGRQLCDLFSQHKLSFDHWIPLAKGGGTVPENMVPLCHGFGGCNNRKRDTDPEVWLVNAFGKRRAKGILERINAYFQWIKEQ
jgi:hypothetical protein